MALTSPVPIVTGAIALARAVHRADAPIWAVHTALAHAGRAARRWLPAGTIGAAVGALITAGALR